LYTVVLGDRQRDFTLSNSFFRHKLLLLLYTYRPTRLAVAKRCKYLYNGLKVKKLCHSRRRDEVASREAIKERFARERIY